jgi:hypothetical protein
VRRTLPWSSLPQYAVDFAGHSLSPIRIVVINLGQGAFDSLDILQQRLQLGFARLLVGS